MVDAQKIELRRVIARQKTVVLATVILVLAGAAAFLTLQRPVYESTASVALLPGTQLNDTLGAYDAVVTRLLPLYASKVRSQTFLDRVANRLGERGSRGELRNKVFAKQDPGAAVLDLVARDQDPARAARLTKAALEQFLAEAEQAPQRTRIVSFEVIDEPTTPTSPVFPRPALILGAALLLAVFLAVAAAVAWDRLFGRVHELDELRRASGERVLGALPSAPRQARRRHPVFVGDPLMAAAEESLRGIRTVLLRPGRPMPSKIAVTSLHPGDGKSTLVANLAVVAAEIGLRVLVVDADTAQPRQHEIFGLSNGTGLSSVVQGVEDAASALQPTPYPRVNVLTAGPRLHDRGEAVESYLHGIPRLGALADLVIVDSPSLTDADVGLLAAVTDGVVFLVRAGSTTARRLRAALDGFEALEVPVLGLVLTMTSRHAASYVPSRSGHGPTIRRRPAPRVRRVVVPDSRQAGGRTLWDDLLDVGAPTTTSPWAVPDRPDRRERDGELDGERNGEPDGDGADEPDREPDGELDGELDGESTPAAARSANRSTRSEDTETT
jgi:Mrp family chromosome partitioning ATPase/capsular polysaccharide biosynthesis protein